MYRIGYAPGAFDLLDWPAMSELKARRLVGRGSRKTE